MPVLAYILAAAFVLLAGPLLALATAKPVPGEIMLAIGPVGVLQQTVVPAAGGRVVGPELARFGALVHAEHAEFAPALLEHGAWFVVDGRRIAEFCGVEI